MERAKVDVVDTFKEDMQEMGVNGSGTHGEATGVSSVTVPDGDNSLPVFQQRQEDLT